MAEKRIRTAYNAEYAKKNRAAISVRLSRLHEPELIEVWEKIPNKSDWMRARLREEMEKQKAGK